MPERDLTTLYADSFDDNSGDWLEPGESNVIEGGEFSWDNGTGHSTRLIGNTALHLMPIFEVAATMEFKIQGVAEVGLYCRLDPGFEGYYRVALNAGGIRISKTLPGDDVALELFKNASPALRPDQSGALTLACFDEPDGFHIEVFLDGELVGQSVDQDPPPESGYVRVSWANLTTPGPHVFGMSSFTLETRS